MGSYPRCAMCGTDMIDVWASHCDECYAVGRAALSLTMNRIAAGLSVVDGLSGVDLTSDGNGIILDSTVDGVEYVVRLVLE